MAWLNDTDSTSIDDDFDDDDDQMDIEVSAPATLSNIETWSNFPEFLLEKVLSFLSLKDRYHCSLVCQHWHEAFYSPAIWRKLVMTSSTFTHQRYTPYKGYWAELSPHKVHMCFERVGSFLRKIQIEPIAEFYNLFEFLRILNQFMEVNQPNASFKSLVNFYFTFSCESRYQADMFVYGTGGKLLSEIKQLLKNLKGLKELKINYLLLDLSDAPGVLENIVNNCRQTLHYLEIRNFTKNRYPAFIVGMFPNLRTLILSPQQLNPDIVRKLANSHLTNLHIVQDHYSEDKYDLDKDVWKDVIENSPDLRVHLSARGDCLLEINWQDGAPVSSIIYTTKFSSVHAVAIDTITVLYNTTLQVYAHFDLPRYYSPRGFSQRCDFNLVNLVRICSKLHTLVIRERISTSTLIILAREGSALRKLYVRKNAIIKRCDWQKDLTWDDNVYETLREASHCYEKTFAEVSRCLRYQWLPLTDKEFMRLKPLYCDNNNAQSDFDTS